MAACPAYGGLICSLCCTLDARCDDLCKPQARLSAQWLRLLQRLLPARMAPQLASGLSAYLLLMAGVLPALALLLLGLYALGLRSLRSLDAVSAAAVAPLLRAGVGQVFAVLLLIAGMVAWWAVLAQRGRQLAQQESRRQTKALNEHAVAMREQSVAQREQAAAVHGQAAVLREQAVTLQDQALALGREIRSHQRTDGQLQLAKEVESFSGVHEQRAKTCRIEAQSTVIARAMASICNDEPERFGVMSGHERKTLKLRGPCGAQPCSALIVRQQRWRKGGEQPAFGASVPAIVAERGA